STVEAQENVAIDVAQDVLRYLTGDFVKNPVNLPSVPSDIFAQIKPYFDLAEKLGLFLIHLTDDAPEEVNIYYSGDDSNIQVSLINRNSVIGLVSRHLGDHVNDIDVLYVAEKKGILIHEYLTSMTKGFTNLMIVEFTTKSERRCVSGLLLDGLGARIVRVV